MKIQIPEKGHHDAIAVSIADEEKEIDELKAQLDVLMELLQR